MAGVHEPAHSRQIALLQGLDRGQHPLVLGDHVAAAAVDDRGQVLLQGLQLLAAHVPQGLDAGQEAAQDGHAGLALLAALVVGAAGQGAAGLGVADDQARLLGEGHPLVVQGAAVDEQGVVRGPQHADELVHDAAGHPHELVLRPLTGQGQLRAGEGILEAGGSEEGRGAGHLQSGGAAQSAAPGHVAADHPLQPSQGQPLLLQGPGHPFDVVDPQVLRLSLQPGQVELLPRVEIQGMDAHSAVLPGPEDHLDVPVQGHGQDEAVVVVRVLADEVDPARRDGHGLGIGPEILEEGLDDPVGAAADLGHGLWITERRGGMGSPMGALGSSPARVRAPLCVPAGRSRRACTQ